MQVGVICGNMRPKKAVSVRILARRSKCNELDSKNQLTERKENNDRVQLLPDRDLNPVLIKWE